MTADTTTGLINQAIRQNIKGRLTQPLNQLQWAHIVMSSHGVSSVDLSSGDAAVRRELGKQLVKVFDSIQQRYHDRLDSEGIHVDEQPAKRARRSRRVRAEKIETRETADSQAEVRLGTARQSAIKNLLLHSTTRSFQALEKHISYIGGVSRSAVSDTMLNFKGLWPGSCASESWFPSPAEEATRNAARRTEVIPKRLRTASLEYNQPLTPDQHEALVVKLLTTFEEQSGIGPGSPIKILSSFMKTRTNNARSYLGLTTSTDWHNVCCFCRLSFELAFLLPPASMLSFAT